MDEIITMVAYSDILAAQREHLFESLETVSPDEFIELIDSFPRDTVINARDKREGHWGRTLLHTAVRVGNLDVVRYLIELGHNVNVFDSSTTLITPLMEAIVLNKVEMSEILVDYGASLNDHDINNENVLHYCARYGSNILIKTIIGASGISQEHLQALASAPNIKRKFPEDVVRNSLMKETLTKLREKGECDLGHLGSFSVSNTKKRHKYGHSRKHVPAKPTPAGPEHSV